MSTCQIGFIGAGRMARAMVQGILGSGRLPPDALACVGGSGESARQLSAETGIQLAATPTELAAASRLIVLAFKPHHLSGIDNSLREACKAKCILSVLAGTPLHQLMQHFPFASNLVRAMPNLPASIGCGVTGYAPWKELEPGDATLVAHVLESIGTAIPVEEHLIDAVTGVSGSGVAFVFEFAASLRDAGRFQGLSEADAERFALETILGAASLMRKSHEKPEALRDKVVTKGGTTEAGIRSLQENGFARTVQSAVAAAVNRAREIAEGR